MNITEIVRMRDFDISQKIKLVRHQDARYDLNLLYKQGFIEFYQSVQSKDVFGNCNYIFSFMGTEGTKSVFIGAYRKVSSSMFDKSKIPAGFPYLDMLEKDEYFYYELERIKKFDDLINRLVIDWGKSTRSWYQWLDEDKDKQVIEILPSGYVKEFPGFDELILTFDELNTIVKNPDANRQWHTMLSSVNGVYLITDLTDGSQYIGSAYGKDGILGRWIEYVRTHHGGNDKLIMLLASEPERYRNFQYSILRALPKSMLDVQVISYEQLYKAKLGTRAFGLNSN